MRTRAFVTRSVAFNRALPPTSGASTIEEVTKWGYGKCCLASTAPSVARRSEVRSIPIQMELRQYKQDRSSAGVAAGRLNSATGRRRKKKPASGRSEAHRNLQNQCHSRRRPEPRRAVNRELHKNAIYSSL